MYNYITLKYSRYIYINLFILYNHFYISSAVSNSSLAKSFFNFGNFFQMEKRIKPSSSNDSFGYGKVNRTNNICNYFHFVRDIF